MTLFGVFFTHELHSPDEAVASIDPADGVAQQPTHKRGPTRRELFGGSSLMGGDRVFMREHSAGSHAFHEFCPPSEGFLLLDTKGEGNK